MLLLGRLLLSGRKDVSRWRGEGEDWGRTPMTAMSGLAGMGWEVAVQFDAQESGVATILSDY
jgi:hypothetical protein